LGRLLQLRSLCLPQNGPSLWKRKLKKNRYK
jgi:hypothetical protein